MSEVVVVQVKWFNAKAGFGFGIILEGERKEKEVFIHHSALKVKKEQFRYLVEGEYVEMEVSVSETEKNKYQGSNVTGMLGGKLMCEIRQEASETVKSRTSTSSIQRPSSIQQPSSIQRPVTAGERRESKPRREVKESYKPKVEL